MEPSYLPFFAFGEDDVSPEAHRIGLSMVGKADGELSVTQPYPLYFALRRPAEGDGKPFIFQWDPYTDALRNAQLVLIRITDRGPERVAVEPLAAAANPRPDTLLVHDYAENLQDLRPGGEVTIHTTLAGNYQRLLVPGERYVLLWRGAEIAILADHRGETLESQHIRKTKLPPLILSASSSSVVTFTTRQEAVPWPQRPAETETTSEADFQRANSREEKWRREELRRSPQPSPPPRHPSERVAGASMLSMEITCPAEWTSEVVINLGVKVTYHGEVAGAAAEAGAGGEGGNGSRPIVFHMQAFETDTCDSPREGMRLYRLLRRGGSSSSSSAGSVEDKWEWCGPDNGFGMFEGLDVVVGVGAEDDEPNSDRFASLRPGESWIAPRRRVQNGASWTSLPEDAAVGDRFKYVCKGAVVSWWDWGTKGDHRDTVVKLPCWIAGKVQEPKDDDGRLQLVVPVSNEVEFTYRG
ncbi:hypothetical protein PG994_010929 [Apiospora phragmitis]|uniref:Uncharacterized protein n=1 Tax=Apiospora phragmitis TaxID=2905665 RepID=A0ABR1TRD2_9PEZI